MAIYALNGAAPRTGSAWVAPDAAIIGDVTLGDGASVWFGAVLRGDNAPIAVGAGCNIQDGCILHVDADFPLCLAEEVTVGHRAVLHGCSIGRRSLVGIGAIILNGAEIGRECLVGAGALVGEGAKIPDRSLVLGVPGRIKRQITGAEAEAFAASAQEYKAKAQRYREGLQIRSA